MSTHRTCRDALETLAAAVARLPATHDRAKLCLALSALLPAPKHPAPTGTALAQRVAGDTYGASADAPTRLCAEGIVLLAAALQERQPIKRTAPSRASDLRAEAAGKSWKALCCARDALALRAQAEARP